MLAAQAVEAARRGEGKEADAKRKAEDETARQAAKLNAVATAHGALAAALADADNELAAVVEEAAAAAAAAARAREEEAAARAAAAAAAPPLAREAQTELTAADVTNGSPLVFLPCSGSELQSWSLDETGSLLLEQTKDIGPKCVDISSYGKGPRLDAYACAHSQNQLW